MTSRFEKTDVNEAQHEIADRGDCRSALRNGFEVGDRAQQLVTMAEQDARRLQILIRHIGDL